MTDVPLANSQSRALVCMVCGMVLVTLQDSTVKILSKGYPLYEIVLARALVAIVVVMAIMAWQGGLHHIKTTRPVLLFARGFLMTIANLLFFMGVVALPLAEALALLFISPVLITLLAIPVLGERVGLWRWLAVLAGFAGVIIMLRPGGDGWRYAALFPVLAACAYSVVQMLARRMSVSERASTMAFYLQVAFIIVASAAGLGFGDGRFAGGDDPSLGFVLRAWAWPGLQDGAVMLAGGVLIGLGNYLITEAYRLSEASSVAPFEYTALPFAMLWGFVFWGDWPDAVAFAGMALIVGSGLFVFWRENVRQRAIAIRRPMPRGR